MLQNQLLTQRPTINANRDTKLSGLTLYTQTFLKILHKHFLSTNAFQNIFNKNTFELSYSCMPNMNSVISPHNCSLLNNLKTKSGFNCRYKANCPLQKKCLTPNTV